MKLIQRALVALSIAACSSGCHDDSTNKDDQPDASFCDGYSDLARRVGCSPPECDGFEAECDNLARRWLTCVRKDLAQCICESDGKLNCEGSFKANEGPALCLEEYKPLDVCLGDD